MTTDEEEGRRQAQSLQPAKIAVGDSVRLKAGTRIMKVIALEDYGNVAVCQEEQEGWRDSHTISALVKVEGQCPEPTQSTSQSPIASSENADDSKTS